MHFIEVPLPFQQHELVQDLFLPYHEFDPYGPDDDKPYVYTFTNIDLHKTVRETFKYIRDVDDPFEYSRLHTLLDLLVQAYDKS